MIEFDVDMGYLLECDELDKVVLNDENGEHEPMEFVPKDAATVGETCRLVDNECGPNLHCTVCGREVGDEYRYFMEGYYGYSRCPHCGRRIEVDE